MLTAKTFYDNKAVESDKRSTLIFEDQIAKHGILRCEPFLYFEQLLADSSDDKNILDLGCGDGENLLRLKGRFCRKIGIDFSEKAILRATTNSSIIGARDVTFIHGNLNKKIDIDEQFDIIYGHGILSFVDTNHLLSECRRLLAPNGRIIFIDTLHDHPIGYIGRKLKVKLGLVPDRRPMSFSQLNELASSFEEVEITHFNLLAPLFFGLEVATSTRSPFLNVGFKPLFKLIRKIDQLLLALPFLKRVSYRFCIILKEPR